MKVGSIGFQEAVELLQPHVGVIPPNRLERHAKKPEIRQVQEVPTENQPFKSTYGKYLRPHPVAG
jgi:hypothetical protein